MKTNKAVILSILFVIVISGPAFTQAVGGDIENTTSLLVGREPVFDQWNKASLWFNTGTSRNLVFAVKGSYTFTLERPYLFDVDYLRLKGNFAVPDQPLSEFGFTLGRFMMSDVTKNILNHRLDGFRFDLLFPHAEVSTAFGFSGLLFSPTSTILLSKADYNWVADTTKVLAPPRLVGMLTLHFPGFLLRQDLTISALMQEDIATGEELSDGESEYQPTKGGLLDTQYAGIRLSGPIVPTLFYSGYFFLNTGSMLTYIDDQYQYAPIIGFMAGGNVRLYFEELLYSRIMLQYVFTSGDKDHTTYVEGNDGGSVEEAVSSSFIPISSKTLGLVFSPRMGNIMYGQFQYSIKPLSMVSSDLWSRFQTTLDAYFFLRSTVSPIADSGIDPDSTETYLGTEIDLSINFRPVSDLGVALKSGLFLPSQAAFTPENSTPRFLMELYLSFSF